MASLINSYIKTEMLETLLKTAKAKNIPGIGITISVNNEPDQFGQNVSAYVSQTKDEREAKKKRFYVFNGKVQWTDGIITLAPQQQKQSPVHPVMQGSPNRVDDPNDPGDLPF